MIKCAVCQGRIRPPKRPWTDAPDGFHFYEAGTSMEVYAKWLARLNKKLPVVHEQCVRAAAPDTLPEKYIQALDLDIRLRMQQRRRAS